MTQKTPHPAAGTQVVALVRVHGTNDALIHPRGAVGVVTRTPTASESHCLVRFPAGFEAADRFLIQARRSMVA